MDEKRKGKSRKQREEALAAAVHVMLPLSQLGDIPNMQEFSSLFWILLAAYYPCRSIVGGQRSHKVSVKQAEGLNGD